jgi:glycosyltransferase involved in cell wall biosynthesis
LPYFARGKFLLGFCNTGPILFRNQLVTIHDASIYAIPASYSLSFRLWYRFMFWFIKLTARKIMTDSQFSKGELQKYAGLDECKIAVVPLAGDHVVSSPKDHSIFSRLQIGQRPYVLFVGSQNIHKNMKGFLDALQFLDSDRFDVVMAGNQNSRVFNDVEHEKSSKVIVAGRVTDAELYALYGKASCFVFPSLYEGFGMPPLEAMASGCPVISSQVASLPEVCGSAAEFCDPRDPRDISQKISKVMSDEALRRELTQKGLEQARKFSWIDSAQKVLQQMEAVCGSR